MITVKFREQVNFPLPRACTRLTAAALTILGARAIPVKPGKSVSKSLGHPVRGEIKLIELSAGSFLSLYRFHFLLNSQTQFDVGLLSVSLCNIS